jgi:hypothetical protein
MRHEVGIKNGAMNFQYSEDAFWKKTVTEYLLDCVCIGYCKGVAQISQFSTFVTVPKRHNTFVHTLVLEGM